MTHNRIIINVITEFLEEVMNTNKVIVLNCVNQVLRCDTLVNKVKMVFDKSLGSEIICVEMLLRLMNELPNIIKEITTFTALTKSINVHDSKYIVYALLYQYLIVCEPNFLEEINEKQLRSIFTNMYRLVEIIPNDIKILKSKLALCFGCCSSARVKNNIPY